MKKFYNRELKSAGFRIKSGMTESEEQGRSMVEMLGVLAVIGVLSVAGIAGYTVAMNKYRANELLNEASKRAVVLAMKVAAGQDISQGNPLSEFSDNNAALGFSGNVDHTDKQLTLTITGVSDDVCNQVKKMAGGTLKKVGPATCSGDNNSVTLTYHDDLSTESWASDFSTPETCKPPFQWCSELARCQQSDETCECPLNSSVDGAGSGTISGTLCQCNRGYKLNGAMTSCISALGQYRQGSIRQKHAYFTDIDDGCPNGYTWVTKAEADALTAEQIENIFTDSTTCDNCNNGSYWLSTCFDNDCSTGYAWGLYQGYGTLKASRLTGQDNGYSYALCIKNE